MNLVAGQFPAGANMKAIESLGGWILDTKAGLVFGVILLLAVLGIAGWQVWKAPKTVILSEKEFTCVASEPAGLGTSCTEYRRFR